MTVPALQWNFDYVPSVADWQAAFASAGPQIATVAPLADAATAVIGISSQYSPQDHVHPAATIVIGLASAALAIATGSTTARTLAARFAERVDVKDFGATGNGWTDDTPAIKAAFAYAVASAGSVYFPPGSYVISSTITAVPVSGLKIYGDNCLTTNLLPTSLTTDLFDLTSGSLTPIEICGLSVEYSGTSIAGTIFNFPTNCGGLNFHDVITIGGWNVLTLGGGTLSQSLYVDRCTFDNFLNNGLTIQIGSGGLLFVSRLIMNCSGANANGIGINCTSGQSITFDTIQMQGMYTPFSFIASSGNFITDCTFTNCYGDNAARGRTAPGGDGWTIEAGGGPVRRFLLTNCWAGSNLGNGFTFVGVDKMMLSNCISIANQQGGFFFGANCTNFQMNNCSAVANSYTNHGAYNGISIIAPCANFVIQGCRCGVSSDFPVASQGYGIAIGAGSPSSNEYIVTANLLGGNSAAGLVNGGTGSFLVGNNLVT